MKYTTANPAMKWVMISLLMLVTSCSEIPQRENPVGREHRQFFDSERVNWNNTDESRPLGTTIWYPAKPGSIERAWDVGIFKAGRNALNAERDSQQDKLPLVVLSHGTGGAAIQLSWLAETLASNGFLVMAVNHHGNTAAEEAYLLQGFMLWWERAQDISSALDQLLQDPKFGAHVDRTRIGAAGFSIGGYTVLSLAGAITDLEQRNAFCTSRPDNAICKPPPEAEFSLKDLELLRDTDPVVKASIARSNRSYKDERIKAVYSIAPVHGPALTEDSLANISIPVRVVVGSKDKQAVPEFNAEPIVSGIKNSSLNLLSDVAHYTFLAPCSAKGKRFVAELCADPQGIDRIQTHQDIGADALEFFSTMLVNSDYDLNQAKVELSIAIDSFIQL